jgi:ABC-type sugar transport system permease subunit
VKKGSEYRLLRNEAKAAWIMLTPALIVLLIIAVYPVLRTFWLSMHEMVLKRPQSGFPFIGLQNYAQIFSDNRAMGNIIFTFKFTIVTVVLELLLGFGAALLMNRPFRGRGLTRAAILVPWAIPTSVSAMMWKFIYNDQYGLFNDILFRLGAIPAYKAWLSTTSDTFMALVITDVWKTFPYMALLILAGLQMLPDELYESAKLDGAGTFNRFRYITLPMMERTLLVASLFRTLDAFRVFDLISVMTGGASGTESIAIYAHKQMMSFLNFGYGSALAVLIFAFVFTISLIYMKFIGRDMLPAD